MIHLTGHKLADYLLFILVVLILAWLVLRVLRLSINRFINRRKREIGLNPTHYVFLKNAMSLIVFLTATIVILYSIPELKQLGLSLFAGAGIIAAIIGFASQAAFSNIISGIFIVIFKPFVVGDFLEIKDKLTGMVEDITLRHTIIRDFENKRFVVPNSVISEEILHNFSLRDQKVGNFLYFNVSFESDIGLAFRIMEQNALAHAFLIDNRTEEELAENQGIVQLRVINVGESAVQLRMMCWTEDYRRGMQLKSDLYRTIKEQFIEQGVQLAFPHRIIIHKQHGAGT